MPKSRVGFRCRDCGVDTGKVSEFFMLKDEVWYLAWTSNVGMLCIEHVEKRLGRELNADDFTDAYINDIHWGDKSAKLVDRLTRRVAA